MMIKNMRMMMIIIRMTGKELREEEEGLQQEEAQVISHMTINLFSHYDQLSSHDNQLFLTLRSTFCTWRSTFSHIMINFLNMTINFFLTWTIHETLGCIYQLWSPFLPPPLFLVWKCWSSLTLAGFKTRISSAEFLLPLSGWGQFNLAPRFLWGNWVFYLSKHFKHKQQKVIFIIVLFNISYIFVIVLFNICIIWNGIEYFSKTNVRFLLKALLQSFHCVDSPTGTMIIFGSTHSGQL